MSEDQDVTGAYYDSPSRTWIYHAGDTIIAQSPPMAEDDQASAEDWFVDVGWFKPLKCWSLGPLNCEKLAFSYINAIPGVGYHIEGKSGAWYWLQDRKAGWNRVIRRFCRDTCAHRR